MRSAESRVAAASSFDALSQTINPGGPTCLLHLPGWKRRRFALAIANDQAGNGMWRKNQIDKFFRVGFVTIFHRDTDAFVTKLNASGSAISYLHVHRRQQRRWSANAITVDGSRACRDSRHGWVRIARRNSIQSFFREVRTTLLSRSWPRAGP